MSNLSSILIQSFRFLHRATEHAQEGLQGTFQPVPDAGAEIRRLRRQLWRTGRDGARRDGPDGSGGSDGSNGSDGSDGLSAPLPRDDEAGHAAPATSARLARTLAAARLAWPPARYAFPGVPRPATGDARRPSVSRSGGDGAGVRDGRRRGGGLGGRLRRGGRRGRRGGAGGDGRRAAAGRPGGRAAGGQDRAALRDDQLWYTAPPGDAGTGRP